MCFNFLAELHQISDCVYISRRSRLFGIENSVIIIAIIAIKSEQESICGIEFAIVFMSVYDTLPLGSYLLRGNLHLVDAFGVFKIGEVIFLLLRYIVEGFFLIRVAYFLHGTIFS